MMKKGASFRACLMTAAAMPMLWAGAAVAASDASTPAASGAPTAVGEIIVTATRKSESLSKVPESVSAFTAARWTSWTSRISRTSPSSRQASPTRMTATTSPSEGSNRRPVSGTTGIYIDDTPIQVRNLGLNANNTLPAVFDLQRVEVLRGPKARCSGPGRKAARSATSPPAQPHPLQRHGARELAFTENGAPSYEGGVAMGGPIVEDKLGFRISAWGRRDGGYVDRVDYQTLATTDSNANRVDTYVLRGAVTWAPRQISRLLRGSIIRSVTSTTTTNTDQSFVTGTLRQRHARPPSDPDRFYLAHPEVEWDAGPVKIISNTAYYDRLERVNGYSATLYNLSYFQHYIDPDQAKYGAATYGYPSDPLGNPVRTIARRCIRC